MYLYGKWNIKSFTVKIDNSLLNSWALFGPMPIIAFEEHVEVQLPPDLDLVIGRGRVGGVHETDTADDLQTFGERDRRR